MYLLFTPLAGFSHLHIEFPSAALLQLTVLSSIQQTAHCMVKVLLLIFLKTCICIHRKTQFIEKNPTRCNSVSKFYYSLFMRSSTHFGRHAAHHQEPKTALAASAFSYVEGRTCSWWTLSGTVYCA